MLFAICVFFFLIWFFFINVYAGAHIAGIDTFRYATLMLCTTLIVCALGVQFIYFFSLAFKLTDWLICIIVCIYIYSDLRLNIRTPFIFFCFHVFIFHAIAKNHRRKETWAHTTHIKRNTMKKKIVYKAKSRSKYMLMYAIHCTHRLSLVFFFFCFALAECVYVAAVACNSSVCCCCAFVPLLVM